MHRSGALFLVQIMLWQLVSFGPAMAQEPRPEYRLGMGDIIQLNVVQQPDLDRLLTIRSDGNAIIPMVGPVAISGLTLIEAEELIRQRLRLYDPSISEISLTVTEYNSLRVYVLGAVGTPGSYTFTSPPTVWDALRVAGGPAEGANLNIARIIRRVGDVEHTETYDLSDMVQGRGVLPDIKLQTGDTVIIPGGDASLRTPADIGVQVFGAVLQPSIVPLQEPTRLVTVLMMSGTPTTRSRLNEVMWVHQDQPDQYRSTTVNVESWLKEGKLVGNPLVYPGDTIHIKENQPSWVREYLPLILSLVTASTTVLLALDRLQ